MLMEDQNRPRPDLKGLWLLPILALGLGVFFAFGKKPPAQHPPPNSGSEEQAKSDAYHHASYSLISQGGQKQPKGYTMIGSAPYTDGAVKRIGPDRFLCSSFLTVRSQSGEMQRERWQCVIKGGEDSWTLEDFKRTPPERITPGGARPSATTADVQ